ncbi:hypothetical protein [Lacticaseibacillus saniviri]|uniref:hypothetical protein n=1 Tax=Lacticaseibacillus saniviri TaxID=931533 RepID=UPI0006D10CBF|nr:hypothetical protein [Lacticaseibacillus saniviri]MCG4281149.1 hypothetical protein [Lacticaseibacillus saniviri]
MADFLDNIFGCASFGDWIKISCELAHVAEHRFIIVCYWPVDLYRNQIIPSLQGRMTSSSKVEVSGVILTPLMAGGIVVGSSAFDRKRKKNSGA